MKILSDFPVLALAVALLIACGDRNGDRGGSGGGGIDAALVAITVTPADPIVTMGGSRQFTATGLYSDGTSGDVTASATWRTIDAEIVSVGDAPNTKGLAAAHATGTTTVTATLEQLQGAATLSVISGPALSEINFHQMALGRPFGNILKLYNPAIDEAGRKLYVSGSKSTILGVVDLSTEELVETFDIGVMGGFLIFDPGARKLYSYDFGVNTCHEIDTEHQTAASVDLATCVGLTPPKGAPAIWGDYAFRETGYRSFSDGTTGFPTDWRQELNGAYGVIDIYHAADAQLRTKIGEIIHGPDALYFGIDQTTGRLYATNSGDGSISVFDLTKLTSGDICKNYGCKVRDIDVGDSIEEVLVDSSGSVYARNRLGGSVIYKYDTIGEMLTVIDNENNAAGGIGMWPTAMALSRDEAKLYALSHYSAKIDVIDTATYAVTGTIQFTTDLKPRIDGISTMTLDSIRDRLFAAWPELGVVGIADGSNNTVLGMIDLTLYGFDRAKAANAGPGVVNLAVNERTNTLYVYWCQGGTGKLLSFDADTLVKRSEASVGQLAKEGILTSNNDKSALYLENRILDASTLLQTGALSRGRRVEAFNNALNIVYTSELLGNTAVGWKYIVYELRDNVEIRKWIIADVGSIVSASFDLNGGAFYIADFTHGTVTRHDL